MFSDRVVLEVKNLTKVYKRDKKAVCDVSFIVRSGEIVGLVGPNGAGKTTILHSILGVVEPTSGSVRIFGKDFKKHISYILSRMNFASAYVYMPFSLKVWENLYVFAKLYNVKNPSARIDELLELLDIKRYKNSITGNLSSGELTRLNICKALLNFPALLLLDEPTASLDPDIACKVRKIIVDVAKSRGMAVLITSHNMRDVEEICDRILFLQNGKLIYQGTTEKIMEMFGTDDLEEVFIKIAQGNDDRA